MIGEVHFTFSVASTVMPHLKSSRLRALAVTSAEPSALFPGLPTVAATLPGYESGSKQGAWAPAGTPPAIISRLNQEIVRYLNRKDVREKLLNTGAEAHPTTPQQFAASIKSEMTRMAKFIKDVGIRAD
jgi:tripartite-type tricarboxylate transporter receptor subunit TctC